MGYATGRVRVFGAYPYPDLCGPCTRERRVRVHAGYGFFSGGYGFPAGRPRSASVPTDLAGHDPHCPCSETTLWCSLQRNRNQKLKTQEPRTKTHFCYGVPVDISRAALVGGYGGYAGRVRVCPGFISLDPYPRPRGYRPVPVAGLLDLARPIGGAAVGNHTVPISSPLPLAQ